MLDSSVKSNRRKSILESKVYNFDRSAVCLCGATFIFQLLESMVHPLLTFGSFLLTVDFLALLIKQPCSNIQTETDFVQVRI